MILNLIFPSTTGKTCSGGLALFGCGVKNKSAAHKIAVMAMGGISASQGLYEKVIDGRIVVFVEGSKDL